jgi:hypothetical protein
MGVKQRKNKESWFCIYLIFERCRGGGKKNSCMNHSCSFSLRGDYYGAGRNSNAESQSSLLLQRKIFSYT